MQCHLCGNESTIFKWLAGSLAKQEPIKELLDPEIPGTVWKENIAIADKYYQPGKFTTFVAYEWTSAPNSRRVRSEPGPGRV